MRKVELLVIEHEGEEITIENTTYEIIHNPVELSLVVGLGVICQLYILGVDAHWIADLWITLCYAYVLLLSMTDISLLRVISSVLRR